MIGLVIICALLILITRYYLLKTVYIKKDSPEIEFENNADDNLNAVSHKKDLSQEEMIVISIVNTFLDMAKKRLEETGLDGIKIRYQPSSAFSAEYKGLTINDNENKKITLWMNDNIHLTKVVVLFEYSDDEFTYGPINIGGTEHSEINEIVNTMNKLIAECNNLKKQNEYKIKLKNAIDAKNFFDSKIGKRYD